MICARPDFLSRFGHDLRAPLASLTGLLRLLAAKEPPVETLRAALMGQALAAALQLQCQVDDAVALSRLESANQPPSLRPVDLPALMLEVLSGLAPVCEALEVKVELSAEGAVAPTVGTAMVEESLLRRALEAIAFQSLRYAARGHHSTIVLRPEASAIRLEWRGFAPGRAPHSLGPVFDPLETGAQGAAAAGLGLRFGRDALRAMGGDLRLEPSQDGRDTDLLLMVTARQAANEPALDAPAMSSDAASGRSARMLLVEDDPVSRRLVEHYLQSRPDIELQVAQSGEEGLAKIRSWQPRLVVTDLRLPDMSGQVLMRRLADECASWRLGAQCVAFSADLPNFADDASAPRPGEHFDETWRKPLSGAQFLAGIDRLLLSLPDPAKPLVLQSV